MVTIWDNVVLEYKTQNRIEVRSWPPVLPLAVATLALVQEQNRAPFPRQGCWDIHVLEGCGHWPSKG